MEKCQKREEGDVCAWTVENVLKTLRFSAIHLKAERRKRNLRRNLKTLFLMRTFFLQVFFFNFISKYEIFNLVSKRAYVFVSP